jgi:hypothetical protein
MWWSSLISKTYPFSDGIDDGAALPKSIPHIQRGDEMKYWLFQDVGVDVGGMGPSNNGTPT